MWLANVIPPPWIQALSMRLWSESPKSTAFPYPTWHTLSVARGRGDGVVFRSPGLEGPRECPGGFLVACYLAVLKQMLTHARYLGWRQREGRETGLRSR